MSKFSSYKKTVFPEVKAMLLAGALAAAFAQPVFAQAERMMIGLEALTETSAAGDLSGSGALDGTAETSAAGDLSGTAALDGTVGIGATDSMTAPAGGADTVAETEAEELPPSIYLDVEELYQYPELPTGCESVALTALLKYLGFELDKTTIVDEYLPYSSNFAEGFDGDPYAEEGGGCYAPGIALAARRYLDTQETGTELTVSDVTGSTEEELYAYLAEGTPVLVWSTMYLSDSIPSGRVVEFDDTEYEWDYNEHCVVLTGYDLNQGTVEVTDPLEGNITRDAERFWEIYEDMGSMAVVIE